MTCSPPRGPPFFFSFLFSLLPLQQVASHFKVVKHAAQNASVMPVSHPLTH